MATLFITEYAALGWVGTPFANNQLIQAPAGPPIAEQHIDIGVGSVASAAFNANTKFIMVCGTADSNLAFGTAPTAATTSHYVPAKDTRFYAVAAGTKVAVIANS